MIIIFTWFFTKYVAVESIFDTSVPLRNSIVIPGQDEETIISDLNLPSLIAIQCKKRRTALVVIKVARSACHKLKKSDFWATGPIGWFRTYPVAYPIYRPEDKFEIAGNPYYVYPMFKPLLTAPGSHTDYLIINEHCQLVGAVILSKKKVQNGKKNKNLEPFFKSSNTFTKCLIEMEQL